MKQYMALFLVSCLFPIISSSLGIAKDKHIVIDNSREGRTQKMQTTEKRKVEKITIGDKFPITIQASPSNHLIFSRKGDTVTITSARVTPKQQQKVMQIYPLVDLLSQGLEKLRSHVLKLTVTVERSESKKAKRHAFIRALMGKKNQKSIR